MYKYKVNGIEVYASGLLDAIAIFRSTSSEELRSVIRYGRILLGN